MLAAKSQAETAKTTVMSTVTTNVVVSFVLSGPLQQLLSAVKHFQIIVHILLINVAYPTSATIKFGMIMELLNFQFVSFENTYNTLFKLDPNSDGNQPLNEQFNLMGYGSKYLVQNFGLLCWTIALPPVLWIISQIIF